MASKRRRLARWLLAVEHRCWNSVALRVRARLHCWAFRQLQRFVQYKAEAAGITVEYIDPAYTSQTCSGCGGIGQRTMHRFVCCCGNRAHSDLNASRNIARFTGPAGPVRAVVNQPVFAHRVDLLAAKSSGVQAGVVYAALSPVAVSR